jgi:hypothetical protein
VYVIRAALVIDKSMRKVGLISCRSIDRDYR